MDHLCMLYIYLFIWVDRDPWLISLVEWVEGIIEFVIIVELRATHLSNAHKTPMPVM